MAILNAATGANTFDYKSSSQLMAVTKGGTLVTDTSDLIFTGIYSSGGLSYTFVSIFFGGSYSNYYTRYLQNTVSGVTPKLVFNGVTQNMMLGGNFNGKVGFLLLTVNGAFVMGYGYTSTAVVRKLLLGNTPTDAYLRGCYDSGSPSYVGMVELKMTFSDVYEATKIVEDRTSSQFKCHAISGSTDFTSFLIAEDQSVSPHKLILIQIDTQYMLLYHTLIETFYNSGSTIFDATYSLTLDLYYAGTSNYIQTNVSPGTITLTQSSGFVMKQTTSTCASITAAQSSSSALTSLGTLTSYTPTLSSMTLTLVSAGVTSTSMTMNSVAQVCHSYAIYTTAIADQSFYYSLLPQTITVTPYTYYPPGGASYTFSYSVSGLPACGSFTGMIITISAACTGSTTTTYTVIVTGTLSHLSEQKTVTFVLTLTPSNLTPPVVSSQSFYYYELPQSITFLDFSQSPSSTATFSYDDTSGFPTCHSFNAASKTITITAACTGSTVSTYTPVVTGTLSAGGSTTLSFSLSLSPVVISGSVSNQDFVYANLPQSFTFSAFVQTPSTGNSITYSISGLPCLTVNSATLIITVSNSCTGSSSTVNTITLTANLPSGEIYSTTFTITLNPSVLTPSVISDSSFYYYELPQTFSFPPFTETPQLETYTYTANGLPSCGSISSSAQTITLDNTCTGNSQSTYTIIVTGALPTHGSTSSTFTLTLNPVAMSGSVSNQEYYFSQLPQTFTFTHFTQTPSSGVTPTYTAAGLPACGSVNSVTPSITLSGICTGSVQSISTVTLTATLPSGEAYVAPSFTITLDPQVITASTILTQSLYFVNLPSSFTFSPFTQSPSSSVTFTYTASGMPACAQINSAGLTITLDATCTGPTTTNYPVTLTGTLSTGESASTNFNILLQNVQILPSNQADLTLYSTQLPSNYQFTSFKTIPSLPGLIILYSITGIPACASFSSSSLNLYLTASCYSTQVQSYTLVLTGSTTSGVSASSTMTLIIKLPSISLPKFLNYTVDNSMLPYSIQFEPFRVSPDLGDVLTYSAIGLPTCAVIDPSSGTITLPQTCEVSSQIQFKVAVRGTLISSQQVQSSNFTITLSCSAPKISTTPIRYQYYYISSPSLLVNATAFTQTKSCHTQEFLYKSYLVGQNSLPDFVSFNPLTLQYEINSGSNMLVGQYKIVLKGSLNFENRIISSEVRWELTVLRSIVDALNQTAPLINNKSAVVTPVKLSDQASINKDSRLRAEIESISEIGRVTLKFSQTMIVYSNFSLLNSSDLIISVLPSENQNSSDLIFNWNCISFTKNNFEISLLFDYPLNISRFPVRVYFLQFSLFLSFRLKIC